MLNPDMVLVDGPNLYNIVARHLARVGDIKATRDYIRTWFDIDRLVQSTAGEPPHLGTVIFHSRKELGSEKTIKLKDREVFEFWARQGSNPYCSTELVALPGTQEELSEAVCPTCLSKVVCTACNSTAIIEERREKGVDTSITTYLLETADNWQSVCLFSGDVDFVPPVRSKRRGKRVFCAVEPGRGVKDLAQVCTSHADVDLDFVERDLGCFDVLRAGGMLDTRLDVILKKFGTRQAIRYVTGRGVGFQAHVELVAQAEPNLAVIEDEVHREFQRWRWSARVTSHAKSQLESVRSGRIVLQLTPEVRSNMEIISEAVDRHLDEVAKTADWRKIAVLDS